MGVADDGEGEAEVYDMGMGMGMGLRLRDNEVRANVRDLAPARSRPCFISLRRRILAVLSGTSYDSYDLSQQYYTLRSAASLRQRRTDFSPFFATTWRLSGQYLNTTGCSVLTKKAEVEQ